MPTPNFDRVARFYDPLAGLVFGPLLLRAQRAALQAGLAQAQPAPRVLFIGGGTGRVLPDLFAHQPAAQVVYLEASARMLAQAASLIQEQLPAVADQISLRHGTETVLQPAEQFDVVVAFFLFDLFPDVELAALVQRLHQHTHTSTRWLVADFAPPHRGWQRGLQWLMYRFFGLTSAVPGRQLPDIAGVLGRLGLQRHWQQQWADGLVEAAVWK
ncbi:class I SAM-dependent methyltransferase [Hymenobacter sp. CRA2]|uniref:class I SAM-dependent methyltransferase n=1 Tax=Hymenobacter sp. CRA2 TaxID=1955620 RepID=UPI00098FF57A|nr:class I SAM-dependent methyltransferase [Hymenobacter sp. CRA2]OON68797.1 hypothetical protein B0919_11470 [Hymenobacter sp. CRA2]